MYYYVYHVYPASSVAGRAKSEYEAFTKFTTKDLAVTVGSALIIEFATLSPGHKTDVVRAYKWYVFSSDITNNNEQGMETFLGKKGVKGAPEIARAANARDAVKIKNALMAVIK